MPDQQNQPSPQQDNAPTTAGTVARTSPPIRTDTRTVLTEKQRNIGERFIEFGIRAVSTLSIIFIFLIFYFVFREASPIILGTSSESSNTAAVSKPFIDTTTARTDDVEVYNSKSGTIAEAGDSVSDMEIYNPETGDIESAKPGDSSSDMLVYNSETGNDVFIRDVPKTSDRGTPAESTGISELERARQIVGPDYPILRLDDPVKPSYLFHDVWQPNSIHPRYGIYSILIGTAKTTLIALLFATPLGILAALYTAFFAPKRIREKLKPILELLAGFPSVVIGFFSLMTIASVVQTLFGIDTRLNAFVGGIGLSLAVIPIIYTITDDALRAVPRSLREAALALGATEWQAAYQVMLPAATPGIFAAVLLGLGRAFGETMIALMATGNAGTVTWNFFDSVRTFAATIGAEMGEVVVGSPHYQLLFLLGVILFIFSFAINFVTEFYVKQRLIKRFRGEA